MPTSPKNFIDIPNFLSIIGTSKDKLLKDLIEEQGINFIKYSKLQYHNTARAGFHLTNSLLLTKVGEAPAVIKMHHAERKSKAGVTEYFLGNAPDTFFKMGELFRREKKNITKQQILVMTISLPKKMENESKEQFNARYNSALDTANDQINITHQYVRKFITFGLRQDRTKLYAIAHFDKGMSLFNWLNKCISDSSKISRQDLLTMAFRLAQQVNCLHKCGIVHGAISLQAAVYNEQLGQVKLLSAGSALRIGQKCTMVYGDIKHIAPEMAVPANEYLRERIVKYRQNCGTEHDKQYNEFMQDSKASEYEVHPKLDVYALGSLFRELGLKRYMPKLIDQMLQLNPVARTITLDAVCQQLAESLLGQQPAHIFYLRLKPSSPPNFAGRIKQLLENIREFFKQFHNQVLAADRVACYSHFIRLLRSFCVSPSFDDKQSKNQILNTPSLNQEYVDYVKQLLKFPHKQVQEELSNFDWRVSVDESDDCSAYTLFCCFTMCMTPKRFNYDDMRMAFVGACQLSTGSTEPCSDESHTSPQLRGKLRST